MRSDEGGIVRLDPATVLLSARFSESTESLARERLLCSVPDYFFRRWLPSGDLQPEQSLTWLYLSWALSVAQWMTRSTLLTRVALPADEIARAAGVSSRATLRRKLLVPVQKGEAISAFLPNVAVMSAATGARSGPDVWLCTVSMTVPVHPVDRLARVASQPEARMVEWRLRDSACYAGSEPGDSVGANMPGAGAAEADAAAPDSTRWADHALEWDSLRTLNGDVAAFEARVVLPLLARLGESDPLSVVARFRANFSRALDRLGWTRTIDVVRRVAGNLPDARYPLSYLRTALEREVPAASPRTGEATTGRIGAPAPREADPEKVALFRQELEAFRAGQRA